jgi:hypothetical protein
MRCAHRRSPWLCYSRPWIASPACAVTEKLWWYWLWFVGQCAPVLQGREFLNIDRPVLFDLRRKDRALCKVAVSGHPLMMKRVMASPTNAEKI